MADSHVLDLPDGVYEDVQGWSGMIRHPDIMAMTAGAYPVKPPSTWFDNPLLANLTPLTITDDGRVFGHIAAWHTSHIGMAGGVKPPRSKTNYAYYRTGVVACSDGKMVDVGQITLTGGHAPLNAGVARAVAHYDDTASAIMDVAAGEDKHGIWVAGALRPDVTDSQLRAIRASSVSGDWRPINGKLELVAVCAVNAPGFPIPRARVASGAPIAMVAAGIEPLIEIAMHDRIEADVEEGIQAGLELFRERILRLETVVLADGGLVQEHNPDMTTEDAVETDWDRTIKLRKRVRGGSALAASLRERVRGPLTAEVVDDVQALAASLRERVKGSDAGPKAPAPEALTSASKNWNPLLHPRGADGKFIEIDSWVRWLHPGYGSTRRGKVLDIIPDPEDHGKVMAKVEFPDLGGKTIVHDIHFDELEKTAPPKGNVKDVGKTGETSEEPIPPSPDAKTVPVEDISSGENPGPWDDTSAWAATVRDVHEQYKGWRETQLAQDPDANASFDEYIKWLSEQGMASSVTSEVDTDSILAHATDYWTDERRQEAAKKGHALPDGGFPIDDVDDLKKAIQAYGRAKHPDSTKKHIIKRAKSLKSTDLLPDGWVKGVTATVESGTAAEQLRGRVHKS